MQECPICSVCQEDGEERCPNDGAALDRTVDGPPLIDGKYRLERRLSQGGMGVVYLARHVDLQRVFALKLIRSASGWEPTQLARFRLEAETLGRLKHPGIVDVTDFGIDSRGGGLPYLVMERLEGKTLLDHCRPRGHLPIEEALPILTAVGKAIDFAHDHGVLHRDLKPANVFLCKSGDGLVVKLLDFGLARLSAPRAPHAAHGSSPALTAPGIAPSHPPGTDLSDAPTLDVAYGMPSTAGPTSAHAESLTPPGSLAGTLRYMAPECFRGDQTTVATDTYALGVTAYFVLVGRHPFEGSAQSIMDGHLHREPARPSELQPALAPTLDAPLLAPLAKEAARRPASADAFFSRLEAAVRAERVRGWRRRELPRRSALAAGIAGLLMVLTPLVMSLGVLRDLQRRSVDARLRLLPPTPPDPRLRLLVLDQASLDGIANPLGSREVADELASRLEGVFAAGARALAIDLLPPPAWSRSEAFSRFVLRHQGALTLAAHVSRTGEVVGPEALGGLTAVALGPDGLRRLFGLVNMEEDGDGVVRQARLGYRGRDGVDQETWPAHAARTLRGPAVIGVDPPDEPFWIDSSMDWKRVGKVAWKDVDDRLESEPSFFAGALVFVGADLAASGDEAHRMASGSAVPGVVVQTMIADTILRGFPIREPKALSPFGWVVAWLGLSLLALALLMARRSWISATAGAVLLLAYLAVSFAVFTYTRTLVPVVQPVVATASLILSCLLLRRRLSPFPAA